MLFAGYFSGLIIETLKRYSFICDQGHKERCDCICVWSPWRDHNHIVITSNLKRFACVFSLMKWWSQLQCDISKAFMRLALVQPKDVMVCFVCCILYGALSPQQRHKLLLLLKLLLWENVQFWAFFQKIFEEILKPLTASIRLVYYRQ
jgi:hypothetical protein